MQAVHELVPPDVLAPVLKQLADQFINDRTRPEVMVVGMRAVRELAQRAPLLMTPDLLQVHRVGGRCSCCGTAGLLCADARGAPRCSHSPTCFRRVKVMYLSHTMLRTGSEQCTCSDHVTSRTHVRHQALCQSPGSGGVSEVQAQGGVLRRPGAGVPLPPGTCAGSAASCTAPSCRVTINQC